MSKNEITELPGVGAATAEKLKEAGYDTLLSIAVASPGEMVEVAGVTEASARKIINAARDKMEMGFETGEELLKKREQVTKISTGSKALDALFGGGIESGAVTEVYGAFGSGKTSLAHQLAVNVQLPKEQGGADGMAIWIDSEGTLRPEFIKNIAKSKGLNEEDALKNFRGARAFNSDHQMLMVEKIEDMVKQGMPIKLIIVDSLMSHFRSEFCVTPDTLITGNPSLKKIKDYNINDKVLTHTGTFKKVLAKQIVNYNGEILKIKPYYERAIKITGDHNVFALKTVRNTCYRKRSVFRKKLENGYIFKKNIGKNHYRLIEGFGPDWVKADTLEKGDYFVYPIVKDVKDIETINISDYVKGNYHLKNDTIKCTNFYHDEKIYNEILSEYNEKPAKGRITELAKKYNLPVSTIFQWVKNIQHIRKDIIAFENTLKINEEFMRLLGYYLAEGSANDHQIRFTFNTKEVKYINDVKKLIKLIFKIKTNKDVIIGNATNVIVSSRILVDLFKNLVGSNALEKKLPQWILYLPIEKQKELLSGYWRGDGGKSKYGFNFNTASLVLAEQTKIILARLGFIPCLRATIKNRKNQLKAFSPTTKR